MPSFYEFFAGGGMARAGLGDKWDCVFANDFDRKKAATYASNWDGCHLKVGDIRDLTVADLPGQADLAWASFPCQDLSLAGGGAGLKGDRSGTFWPLWQLMQGLGKEARQPKLIVLENVCGTLTSHGGADFAVIAETFVAASYRMGAMVIDAERFLPQSRPRLFIIGVHQSVEIPPSLTSEGPVLPWHTKTLLTAQSRISPSARKDWVWWRLQEPASRCLGLADVIEATPTGIGWHSKAETEKILGMMSDINWRKVEEAQRSRKSVVGTVYKRTRRDEFGRKVQRAEVRFDNISGCLRTPAGGSSRQVIIVVQGSKVRTRLISPREMARLMGLPDIYKLPENYNEAYHLAGDGVAAPVVSHLARQILEPILDHHGYQKRAQVKAAA